MHPSRPRLPDPPVHLGPGGPPGPDRFTDYGYDAAGNQLSRISYRGGEVRREQVETQWNSAGWPTAETVHNGDQLLRREMTYDQRGNLVAVTDPRGTGADYQTRLRYTTDYQYDEYDRVTATVLPPLFVEPGGGAPAEEKRPTSEAGFDTFGNPTHAVDSRGHHTTNHYDLLDRLERTEHPAYQRPGGGDPLAASESFEYDRVGNLRFQVSRRGEVTEFVYDNLNRVFEQRDPSVAGAERGTVRYGYDNAGNRVLERDQEGAVTRWEHDDLNRVRRQVAEVRPVAGAGGLIAITTFDYDDLGRLTYQQDPAGGETSHEYNAAGERTKTTLPATAQHPAAVTTVAYDMAGRPLVETMPLGRRTEHVYDNAGRETFTRTFEGDEPQPLTTTGFGYDAAGNQTSRTAPRGYAEGPPERFTTTYDYDAGNRLVTVAVPARAGTSLRTGYGYDAAGNLTRVTDGNGRATFYAYQAWGLLEDVVEPSTAQHPDLSERTWTTSYDQGGLPVEEVLPGGVTVRRRFDDLGRPVYESGCRRGTSGCLAAPANPDAPEATRRFSWDRVGRRVEAVHPRGPVTLTYDDRDLLVSATGGAGSARFRYDPDGRMTYRSDDAGASEFTWTQAGELASATDPLTGVRRDYAWDDAGQLREMELAGRQARNYFYDGLGRVEREVLWGPTGEGSDFRYDYDPDGNLLRQQVTLDGLQPAADNPGEGLHRYCYDDAGRITRWDRRQPADPDAAPDCAPVDPAAPDAAQVVDYRWDGAGNRLAAGGQRFSYDQRNRLTSSPDGDHTWTARGTLTGVTKDGAHTPSTFDALGRQVGAGDLTLDYDGLDRLATRQSPSGSTEFEYAGAEIDPVSSTGELVADYARSPGGRLLAQTENGGPPLLAGLGRHGDLTLLHTPDGTLHGSAVYDPFGKPAGTAGTGSRLGYQADWTDPSNGQVWMGARWYDPANAQFTSRDTVMGELTTPVALNRYTYAVNNPLAYFDPDGRRFIATFDGNDSARDTAASTAEMTGHNPVQAAQREDRRQAQKPNVQRRAQERIRQRATARIAIPTISFLEERADQYRQEGDGDEASAMNALIDNLIDAWTRDCMAGHCLDPDWLVNYSNSLWAAGRPADASELEAAMMEAHLAVLTPEQIEANQDALLDAASWDPGLIGNVASGVQAADAWGEGNKWGAVGYAVGAVPAVGGAARLGFRLGRGVLGFGDEIFGFLRRLTGKADDGVEAAGDVVRAACSFTATTGVAMADGTTRVISDIDIGDYVLAEDPETGERGPRKVTHLWEHQDTVVDLLIDGDLVTTTEDHPFWNATDHEWQQAQDLDRGDHVRTADGELAPVEGIQLRSARRTTAYNLTVDGIHTYFVAVGEDEVLVHNTCPTGSQLRGKTLKEVGDLIPESWVESPTRGPGGVRYSNPARPGEQVRIMPGNPADPNPLKRGPYARISTEGQVSDPIPLYGNPNL